MIASIAIAALVAAPPQSPTGLASIAPRAPFCYPDEPAEALVAPFEDATGLPLRIAPRSAGAADVDGDGNLDVWFVAGSGPRGGDVEVLSAHTADLGRFVPYGAVRGGAWRAGVTFHRAGVPDAVVLLDPASAAPSLLFYQPGAADPRAGTIVVQPTIWPVGVGAIDVDARDPDADGHDDLVVLRELRSGATVTGCEIARLHFGVGPAGHQLLSTAALQLPFAADRLRAADLDGDGATDVVVHLPGLGVFALGIDASGAFRLCAGLELGAGLLRDLTIADLGGDGRDDWVAVLPDGCIVGRSLGATATFVALPRPAAVATLCGARCTDATGDGVLDVVAIPRTGGVLAVHPFVATTGAFGPTELRAPPPGVLSQGPGIGGVCAVTDDLDGDGDPDLLLQAPTGDSWITLRGAARDLAPDRVAAATIGAPSAAGFVQQSFTIDVPPEFFVDGFADVEVGVFVEDPATGAQVFWDRDVVRPDPATRRVVVTAQAMLDPLNRDWLWNARITRHPQTGEVTVFGPTVVTIHAKRSTQRARSTLVHWDGQGDPHGSAVGVRWRVVAAPPLPKSDAQLLPWD